MDESISDRECGMTTIETDQKISPADLPDMSNRELVFTHAQLHKFWKKHFAGNALESSDGSSREDIINSEIFLEEEMQARGISHVQHDELDKQAVALTGRVKIMRDVKIAQTEDYSLILRSSGEAYKTDGSDIVLIPDFISEVGGTIEHPGDANDMDFVVRIAQSDVTRSLLEGIYLLLRKKFDPEKKGIVHILPAPEGPHGDYKPIYDLVMRPKIPPEELTGPSSLAKLPFGTLSKEYTGQGGMVAWYPPPEVAEKLALPDGEPPEELHSTLIFFPDIAAVQDKATEALEAFAKEAESLKGKISGVGRFNASDSSEGKDVFYAVLDVPGLEEMHTKLAGTLREAGAPFAADHGFNPHITLKYLEPEEDHPLVHLENIPIVIDRLCLCSAEGKLLEAELGRGEKQKQNAARQVIDMAQRAMVLQETPEGEKARKRSKGNLVRFGWDIGDIEFEGQKFNPHHGAGGRFASGGGGGETPSAMQGPVLNSSQKASLDIYRSAGYQPINGGLRGSLGQELSPKAKLHIKQIDSAVGLNVLDRDVVAYRGVTETVAGNLKSGQKFRDKGYVSTSLDSKVAGTFAKRGRGTVLEVRIPKGSHALYMDAALGSSRGEKELLLGRGAVFSIDGRSSSGHLIADYQGSTPSALKVKFGEKLTPGEDSSKPVPPYGPKTAKLVVVGDGPGRIEQREGKPMVGPSGKFLRAVLEELNMTPDEVYWCNIYEIGNRAPTPEDTAANGKELLAALDDMPNLRAILAVSEVASEGLTGQIGAIGELRKGTYETPGNIPIIVTYHPSALLRTGQRNSKYYREFRNDVGKAVDLVQAGKSEKVIIKEDGKWVLYSRDRSRVLGRFDTEKEAIVRERQIQFFKHERKEESLGPDEGSGPWDHALGAIGVSGALELRTKVLKTTPVPNGYVYTIALRRNGQNVKLGKTAVGSQKLAKAGEVLRVRIEELSIIDGKVNVGRPIPVCVDGEEYHTVEEATRLVRENGLLGYKFNPHHGAGGRFASGGGGSLPVHQIHETDVGAYLKDSQLKNVGIHRTDEESVDQILKNGVDVAKAGGGMYGQGFYTAEFDQPAFGNRRVQVAIKMKNPLVVDLSTSEGTHVMLDTMNAAHTDLSSKLGGKEPPSFFGTKVENRARKLLVEKGYDGVIVKRGKYGDFYVGIRNDNIKVIVP